MRTSGWLVFVLWMLLARSAAANDYQYQLQSPGELQVSEYPGDDITWMRAGAAFSIYPTDIDAAAIRKGALRDGEDVDPGVKATVCGQTAVRLTSVRNDPDRRIQIVRQIVTFAGAAYLEFYAHDEQTGSDPAIAATMQQICDESEFVRAAAPPGWVVVRQLGLWPGDGWTNYLRLWAVDASQLDAVVDLSFADLSSSQAIRRRTSEPIELCGGMRGRFLTAIVRPAQGGDFIAAELAAVSPRHGWLLEYLRPKDRIEDPRAVAALRGFCAK